MLDVACGTGEHDRFLCADYRVDGIDLNPEFVRIAKSKNPAGDYHVADMVVPGRTAMEKSLFRYTNFSPIENEFSSPLREQTQDRGLSLPVGVFCACVSSQPQKRISNPITGDRRFIPHIIIYDRIICDRPAAFQCCGGHAQVRH
jgi:hypothetical protein